MQVRRTPTPNNPPTGLAEGQLSVGMGDNPPTVWVGVPTSIDASGRVQLLPGSFVTSSALTTALGGYLPLTGGTLSGPGTLQVDSTITTTDSITAGDALIAYGDMNYGLFRQTLGGATSSFLNFSPNYFFRWVQTSTDPDDVGSYQWGNGLPNQTNAQLYQNGNFRVTGILQSGNYVLAAGDLRCNGTGVRYLNIQSNGWNFRWDGGAGFYVRMDNTLELFLGNVCDERLKRDIAPSRFDCLTALLNVPLYQYRWANEDETVPVGLVAQRLNEVFPDAVARGRGDPKGATTMWNADTNTMLATLVGAVQQLLARIERLEAKP